MHDIRLRSASDSELFYELGFTGGVKPGSGIGGRDRIHGDGKTASGRLVEGVDHYRYWGAQDVIAASDPDDLELKINDKSWTPARKYGATRLAGHDSAGGGEGGSPNRPKDENASVPTSENTSAIANERPGLGCVARPFYSQGDIEIHVGRGRRFESLQAAFNAIPHFVLHEVRIHIHGRTRDRNTAHIHSVSMANHVDFIVDGSDGGVVNDGGVNVSIDGKLDHIQFDDIEFEHISQCKDARFTECVFGHNGRACFSGKMGAKMLIDCEFKPGADYAVESIGGEMVEIRNCELNASEAAVKGTGISMHAFVGDNTVNAPEKYRGYANEVWSSGKRLDT